MMSHWAVLNNNHGQLKRPDVTISQIEFEKSIVTL